MKYQRIIEALYRQPLAISVAGFEALDQVARPILLEGKRPDKDFFDQPMPQMEIVGDVAVIPVFGPLMQHADLIEKKCGLTSYDDIREDLETAAKRACNAAVLNFNSPGGQMVGCLELADFIAEFQEEAGLPVYAFTDSQMCSAAYCLAAGCDQVFATRGAMTGSIGCILGWVDVSKKMEMAGEKAVVFSSGKFKAAGTPGLPLDQEQSDYLQGLVDDAFAQFSGHVLEHRPEVNLDSMQGQIMWGEKAEEAGLVDDCVNHLSDVVDFLEP